MIPTLAFFPAQRIIAIPPPGGFMPFLRALRSISFVSLAGTVTFLSIALATFNISANAQNVAPGPNSDPTYQALRNLTLGSEAVSVSNLELKRDAGTLHLHSGTVCFVVPVNGKVTGAVFNGDGNFVLDPPDQNERNSLKQGLKTKPRRVVLNYYDDVLASPN
jgi:hypothetical protein